MNHTVSLYFDASLETTLLSAWQRLSALGLESLNEAGNGTIRPHITLSAYEEVDNVEALVDCCTDFALQYEPMSISFQSVGLFPSDVSVLFFAPKVTRELLSVHHRLHKRLGSFADSAIEYYTVERWVPHSTISVNVPRTYISKAISAMMEGVTFPLIGQVTEIVLDEVTFDPLKVRPIASTRL